MNPRRLLPALCLPSVAALAFAVPASPTLASSPAATTTTSTTTTTAGPTTTTGPTATPGPTTAPGPPTTTTAPLTGQGVLSAAMNAMAHQRGVTWTYQLSAYGGSYKEVVHDGVKDGTMSSSLTGGGLDAHIAAILDGKVFVNGNAVGLAQFDSFKPAAAQAQANRWISVPRSSRYFSAFALNLTIQSALQELYLGNKVTVLSPTTINRVPVNAVRETASRSGTTVNETVFVRSHGTPLPVKVIVSVNGIAGSIIYGNWGRPPQAHVPKKALAFKASWLQGA